MTKTMEVEFTDEQFEKVKAMESKGISVGEAIDMLFRIQKGVIEENSNQLEQKRAEINEKKAAIEAEEAELNRELENFNKLMDTGLDVEEKEKIIAIQYNPSDEEDYEDKIIQSKQKVHWMKDIFKL